MDNKILLMVIDAALVIMFAISLWLQIKSYYKYENGLKDTRRAFILSIISCLFVVCCLFLRDSGSLFLQPETSEIVASIVPTITRICLGIIALVGVLVRMGSKFQFLEAEYWKQKFLKLKRKEKL